MTKKLTISIIAKEIGVSVETIRYYERIGLISQPVKPESGYRIYDDEILKKLYFIKRAKKLGFSLNEISDILVIGSKGCKETKDIASLKLLNGFTAAPPSSARGDAAGASNRKIAATAVRLRLTAVRSGSGGRALGGSPGSCSADGAGTLTPGRDAHPTAAPDFGKPPPAP